MNKKVVNTKETKRLSFQVKAIGVSTNEQGQEVGKIEAYGAVFNNVDDGNDKILDGSFTRTIKNSKSRAEARKNAYMLKMLWQHKTDEVIGGWADVSEDSFGLKCTGDVLLATQRGKEYYELAKGGFIDEFSIIYEVMPGGAKYDKSGVRELSELRLFSIDPVTFGMNDETYLVGVKSASGRHMNRKGKEKKTVQEHYAEEMCEDLLTDWQDVFLCSLTCAILDAFKIGDQPEQDISQALDDFKELVLTKFVPEAIECDLSGYIADHSDTYSSADYAMQYDSDSKPNYGWMSSNRNRSEKLGKPISSTNQQKIDGHVKSIKALAKSAKAAMQDHANAMHDTADTVADLAGGDNSKSGRAISAATAQSIKSAAEAMHDHADKAFDIMKEHTKAVRTAADDFANTMQGAEKPYEGDDPGKPDDDQQEGKSNPATPSHETRSTSTHSLKSTADEDERELELALASLLQELR